MVNFAEFYGKLLFKENGIPIPEGYVANSIKEVEDFTEKIGKPVILKSQVLTGGRGKAGGIVPCPYEKLGIERYPTKVGEEAKRLFKLKIKGYPVRKILVGELSGISHESYLALTYDDFNIKPLIMWSEEGGMDVEELAKHGKVQKIPVDDKNPDQAFVQIKNPQVANIAKILYFMQGKYDADLLEINPLATTYDGRIIAADSKITIDDGALFRQQELYQGWTDAWYGKRPRLSRLERMERRIKELDLAYVLLDGNIGVIGNGAGLTMATLDTISHYGGKPANFLDVGGGASSEKMKSAINLALSNPRVEAFLINIFGGITNCVEVANGIVGMKKELEKVPVAVRLSGYNYEEGIRILNQEGIQASTNLNEALSYMLPSVPISKRIEQAMTRKIGMPTIFSNEIDEVIVQGITGQMGRRYTELMLEAGTKVVAGVTPDKGGQEVCGLPVYNTVEDLLRKHPDANASVVFVQNRFAYKACHEAIENGIKTIVMIPEHIPNQDTMKLIHEASERNVRIIGPNTPGVISPGKAMMGIIPYKHFMPGDIGIMSRSGTLTYEVADSLTKAGYGQSICVGTGGDRFNGMSYVDLLKLYEMDEQTKVIVMIGEIGGTKEEQAAEYISKHVKKPVVAYIAGRTAPVETRMGHAGAIISMGMGTYESKCRTLERARVTVVDIPEGIPLKISEFYKNDQINQ